jgi:hypothetical protein
MNKLIIPIGVLVALSGCTAKNETAQKETAAAPSAASSNGSVLRVDPALDALVPTNATIEKVAGGFQFTEGPLWSRLDICGLAMWSVMLCANGRPRV